MPSPSKREGIGWGVQPCSRRRSGIRVEVLLARLAYANDEGHVVVAELAGAEFSISSQRDLSDRGRGASSEGSTLVDNWPTWSPDGTRVAFVRVELAGG